jgi:hypothetical protein
MGGKEGKSQTSIEIPDWLDTAMKTAVSEGLNDFNAFRKMGMGKIMPPEGQTNVNVRNPWEIVAESTGAPTPHPGDPVNYPPTNGPQDSERPTVRNPPSTRGGGGSMGGGRGGPTFGRPLNKR